jgi:hypothetical protein
MSGAPGDGIPTLKGLGTSAQMLPTEWLVSEANRSVPYHWGCRAAQLLALRLVASASKSSAETNKIFGANARYPKQAKGLNPATPVRHNSRLVLGVAST